MECFADESINEITAQVSAQSAKTLTILCLLAWAIDQDPGPILWVTSDVQEARKFAKSRLLPLLEKCDALYGKIPTKRGDRNTLEIYFPGAPLIITGSKSPGSLQQTPYRYLFLDEVRSYPPGALEMIDKRTRSYPHNYKKVIISTPDAEDDTLDRAFKKGTQEHFIAELPCGHRQEMAMGEADTKGGLKWDTNETTKPEGVWHFPALRPTVRYECAECGAKVEDHLGNRKHISSHGEWEKRNLNAPSNCVSFTWSALLPWWTSWGIQVEEFLNALKALKVGDHEPLKSFVTETQGRPWTDKLRYRKFEKFLATRHLGYDARGIWDLERRRFATIDVQGKGGRHYYLVVRAWGAGARSRLLHVGVYWDYTQLIGTCSEWGVAPENIAWDVGNWQTELFQRIVEGPVLPNGEYAMKALWGDDKPSYQLADQRMLYNIVPTDPALGFRGMGRVRPINVYRWAKPAAQDRLDFFMHGGGVSDWRLMPEAPMDYRQQVTAWDRREFTNQRGEVKREWAKPESRPDHYYSCELMQIICASAAELLSYPQDGLPLFEHAHAQALLAPA